MRRQQRRWHRLVAVLLVLVAVPASALDEGLRQLGKDIAGHLPVQGEFEQLRHLKLLNKPIRSSGRFSISADKILDWNTLQPLESRLRMTPEGVTEQQAGVPDRTVSFAEQPVMATFAKALLGIFSGDFEPLEENFRLQWSRHGQCWQLRLEPRSAEIGRAISHLEITGDRRVHLVGLHDTRGDHTEIRFRYADPETSPGPDQPIPDEERTSCPETSALTTGTASLDG